MDQERDRCPNCGGQLVPHRDERQAAGQRCIELSWDICRECRHVALRQWSMGTVSGLTRRSGERERRTGRDRRRAWQGPPAVRVVTIERRSGVDRRQRSARGPI